ncbi:hypothetical protein ANCCAN_13809 [Ancylostoma caninum]|uniref:Uncharacterized protein n=1 Tax=Ancylostoma caninum TaxID=29170 RepID=A0A368GBW7_ANCCA|nr:hypothetical protein ANCCAN_13809 [Ancylostoma caninum]
MSATEDEDTFDEDDVKPAPIFRRGLPRQTNSFSRLSTAIRRSLRLTTRSSSLRSSREKEDSEWESLRKKDACPRFTKNSDTYIGASSVPSRIEEIRENRRLNRTDAVSSI